jgi:ATP-dependent Clp protease ATP-binding subunit ClpA
VFERFTQEARQSVVQAQHEARAFRHTYIGVEHVLLGMLTVDNGPAARALAPFGVDADAVRRRLAAWVGPDAELDAEALASLGIDLDQVRRATEEIFGPGALDRPRKPGCGEVKGHIPFTPRAKKSLQLALREALRLNNNFISDGHLLLGMLRADPNGATKILDQLGVPREALRDAVVREIRNLAA